MKPSYLLLAFHFNCRSPRGTQGDVGARSATCVLREPREVLSACWAHCSDRAMMETVKENQAAGKASGSSPCRAVFLRCCSCARPADSAEDA